MIYKNYKNFLSTIVILSSICVSTFGNISSSLAASMRFTISGMGIPPNEDSGNLGGTFVTNNAMDGFLDVDISAGSGDFTSGMFKANTIVFIEKNNPSIPGFIPGFITVNLGSGLPNMIGEMLITTGTVNSPAEGGFVTIPSNIKITKIPIPEPTSNLALLAFGTLGVASVFKCKMKPSKSTKKETTKVS